MTSVPDISILVPCYNVETYLPQCLDSLINQTLKNIEIIAINDVSTDKTLSILQEYAAKDSRVIIIDKPNEGYGKSMNRGLKKAHGKYIGIVESDDWADVDMFGEMFRLATTNRVQVVKSAFYNYSARKGNKKQDFLADSELNRVLNPKENSAIFYYQPCIWSAIYERAFLEKYQIDFLESPGASYQDIGFNFKVWLQAERVWFTPKAFLHYRNDNAGSSIHSQGKVFCVRDEWVNIEHYLQKYPHLERSSRRLRNYVKFNNYFWNLKRLGGENRRVFHKHFVQEYGQIFVDDGIKWNCFTTQTWLKILKQLFPYSLKWWSLYWLQKLSRPLLVDKIKQGKKTWYFFFGLIPIKTVNAKFPGFGKEN